MAISKVPNIELLIMFYHVQIYITGISSWFVFNLTKEQILLDYLCPFIRKEVVLINGKITNFSSIGSIEIHKSLKPIDSDWPIKKADYVKADGVDWNYNSQIKRELNALNLDVTNEIYIEGLKLIDTGKYIDNKISNRSQYKTSTCFFICPFDNQSIDHNYEFAIKPVIEKINFEIKRADEISHTKLITEVIIDSINNAQFVIADLSEERPNCYYEVGYAHSLGKPVLIIAKDGTKRHFDIASYKWIYYNEYTDLKRKLEIEVNNIFRISQP